MNKEVKALWLDALRSGDYEQGKGYLQADGKFCCLGVLCDIYRRETGGGEWGREHRGSRRFTVTSGSSELVMLPGPVSEWAEVTALGNPLGGEDLELPQHNDCGSSFEDIAGIIERNL